ncbi:AAA family ATPase [Candidatus Aerophobetes bacterium]|nr:AAA family ATPase [Candidatus Aerophobetes bacterium]
MKIKEFSIMRYGPLRNTGKVSLRNFNLLFGKNEDGKTLTIDALVKLLVGRNIRDFEEIDRVEEKPEGYVILENDKGEEIKLPEKGDIAKVAELTPSECCNIFIVRNSKLSIARDAVQESEFYTNVTDRLTGLRTEEILRIKKTLAEFSKITPTGIFRDIKDEKLKTRIENANRLIEEIERLNREIEEQGYDKLEEESVTKIEKMERMEHQIDTLEDARRREVYEKGKDALDKIKEALEKLKGLEIYREADEQLWRDCERDINACEEENKKYLKALEENEEEFKKTGQKLEEIEREFQVLDKRKEKLDNEIRPDLKDYENKREDLAKQEGKSKFFTSLGIISAILFGVSLPGVIFRPSLLSYIFALLFFILMLISGIFKFQFVKNKAHLAGIFERNKLALAKFGLDAQTIEGIFSNVQRFEEDYRKKYDELQELKNRKEHLDEKINKVRDETIPEMDKKIKKLTRKIDEIKEKSKEKSLQVYSEKLYCKQELEVLKKEQESVLSSHFGKRSESLEENILHWEKEITNQEQYKNKVRDAKYSESAVSKLKEEKKKAEDELKKINDRMVIFQKEMDEVQRKANEIIRLEGDFLYCTTLVELEMIKHKLQGFIEENESTKDDALEVMKIFEEIEAEEKEKVSLLFGSESAVSNYFHEITDGLYEEVSFNQETGKIEVKRKDGKVLDAGKLSGGAFDQLYFSIRLALGKKLLKDGKGFFIMDDPFVKADSDRLRRQIEVLRKISHLGWQVVYFSAKGEVKDVLKQDIEKQTINYVEVEGIFS